MHVLSQFFDPPRLRTLETGDERRATWLELFFDLVFVVAVAQLGANLTGELTAEGFAKFVALFVPVWWAWAGFTFYATRFDTDDLPYRLWMFVAMFGVAAVAIAVTEAFAGGSARFAISYVCVRLVLIVLYARALRHVPAARPLAALYSGMFATAVVVWLLSLAVDTPARYWLWGVALACELSAPFFGWRRIPKAPIHPAHVPERFGLLTIIVLGESVFAVVLGIEGAAWDAGAIATSAGGFLAAVSIWWLYFEFLDESMVARSILRGLTFTYMHFAIVVGIAGLGIGVKAAVLSAGGKHQYDGTAWVMCAGLALCMLGLAGIHLATPPRVFDGDVALRLGSAVVALALLPFAENLSSELVTWILATTLLVQVVWELLAHVGHNEPRL